MCVEFSFSEGVYKHRDVGSGVKNEATGSYLLYIHFFLCDYNAKSYQNRWSLNKVTVLSTPFHFTALYHQSFVHPCRRKRDPSTGHEIVPSTHIRTAGNCSFISRGAQISQLTQNHTGETCRPCSWKLEVSFVVQVFLFLFLYWFREGWGEESHIRPFRWAKQIPAPASVLLYSKVLGFIFVQLFTATFLKVLLWYGLST